MQRYKASLAIASVLVACSSPAPPTLTPKQATVSTIDANGVSFVVDVDAFNPNGFPLVVQKVTAKTTLDGRYDLGTSTVASTLEIPAKGSSTVSTPLVLKWQDVTALATLAASNRPVPFEVVGTVAVGSPKLNVEVPFRVSGALRHDDLVQAAARSIPKIPGLPGGFPTMR